MFCIEKSTKKIVSFITGSNKATFFMPNQTAQDETPQFTMTIHLQFNIFGLHCVLVWNYFTSNKKRILNWVIQTDDSIKLMVFKSNSKIPLLKSRYKNLMVFIDPKKSLQTACQFVNNLSLSNPLQSTFSQPNHCE